MTRLRPRRLGRGAIRPAALLLTLALAPLAQAADGPYVAVGYGLTGFETRCDGGACDRRDSGYRLAAGWGFAQRWSVEVVYLDAGQFIASDRTADGTSFQGHAEVSATGLTLGYALPLGEKFSVGARLGASSVKADFHPGPAPAISGGKTETQFLGGLSGTWQMAPAWTLRLDWDHTKGRMNRFDGDVNVVALGLQYGF